MADKSGPSILMNKATIVRNKRTEFLSESLISVNVGKGEGFRNAYEKDVPEWLHRVGKGYGAWARSVLEINAGVLDQGVEWAKR
jgi:hypothetical protein